MNRRVCVVVLYSLLAWSVPATVRGQLTAGPAPVMLRQATQVVEVWRPDQHLYVKGDLGVGRAQLDELEQWLDQNGQNWTVVLIDDSVGEKYRGTDGRYYEGLDAVEQALGRGLSNLTSFGTQQDSRTGESNGAIFALSLGDRNFSYFASDAQDRRGLGESQWRGRLDRPAYEAMANGGRIVDAAKNTVQSINRALDRAIAGEEQERISLERERERNLERLKLLVERARAAMAKVAGLRDTFVGQHATAKGLLARPPLDRWQQELDAVEGQQDESNLLPSLQRAGTLMDEIEGVLLAYREDTAFPNRWQALKSSVDKAELGPNAVARKTIDEARDVLVQAQTLRDNGDRESKDRLDQTEVLLTRAKQEVAAEQNRLERLAARRRLIRRAALATLSILLLLGALLLAWLNRRLRPVRAKALERLAERREQIRQTTDGMLGMLERTQMLIGKEEDLEKRGSRGRTLEVSRQTIDDVDNLFIMSRTVDSVLRRAEGLIQPRSILGRLRNLFQMRPFQHGIELLDEQTLRFSPEEGIPILPDEQQEDAEQLLGDVARYESFEMTYEGLLDQYKRRFQRATKSLDALDESWRLLAPNMDALEHRIEDMTKLDEQLKAEAAKDGYFKLPSLSQQVIPAVQAAHAEAEKSGVGDPLTAMQVVLSKAQRQSEQSHRLVSMISQFRTESLPALRDTAQTLANEGRQIAWVDDFLRQLSERAEQLMRMIATEDASQPLEEFSHQLQDLVVRARRCAELDQITRNQAAPQLAACEKATAQAREQIAAELQLPPQQILRETGADPDQLLAGARQQLVSATASLDRGAFLPAEAAIKEVEHLVAESKSVIQRTREGLQQQPTRRTELTRQSQKLADEATRCQSLFAQLKREFAPSAFMQAAAASEENKQEGALIDTDQQLAELLRATERNLEASEQLRQQGKVLQAIAELDEAQATLTDVSHLCERVTEIAEHLRKLQEENRQKLETVRVRCEKMVPELEDQRTMERTRIAYRECVTAYEAAERYVSAGQGGADPNRAAAALETAEKQLDEVAQSITADRDVYAEAARSCEAARNQLQTALSLAQQAASDRLPDSDVTSRAIAQVRGLASQSEQLRLRLTVPHEDWQKIDQQADQLTLQAGQAAAALRGDLDRGQRCVQSLQEAAEQVRLASGWTGMFGINIMGSPGGDDLELARAAFARGDYDQAMRFATNATALASRAVQEAEMRVRERRRAEQQQREARQRRSLPPIIIPGSGGLFPGGRGINIGPSHWPGSGGSVGPSFRPGPSSGGSPGSGFQRSGW